MYHRVRIEWPYPLMKATAFMHSPICFLLAQALGFHQLEVGWFLGIWGLVDC